MPKILTQRKQKWVNKFKTDILRGDPLNPSAANEVRYYQHLNRLIEQMTGETERELRKLFNSETAEIYFAEDKSIAIQARILTRALTKKFDGLFAEKSQPIAEQVANNADKSSSVALHSSIQKLSGGLSLPTSGLEGKLTDILSATISENVSLIKSISSKYLADVEGAVMRSITTGNGLQDLIPFLADNKGITLRRARMISHDQTRKAFNGLNKGRMQAIGITEAQWIHTAGSHKPRKSHIEMSGKAFKLSEGLYDPAAGKNVQPGEEVNCRCRYIPIITFGNKKDV